MAVFDTVKIQRPVVSNQENPPALVYNKDRSVEFFTPFDTDLAALMGDELKIFAIVKLFGGKAEFVRRAPWQEW